MTTESISQKEKKTNWSVAEKLIVNGISGEVHEAIEDLSVAYEEEFDKIHKIINDTLELMESNKNNYYKDVYKTLLEEFPDKFKGLKGDAAHLGKFAVKVIKNRTMTPFTD